MCAKLFWPPPVFAAAKKFMGMAATAAANAQRIFADSIIFESGENRSHQNVIQMSGVESSSPYPYSAMTRKEMLYLARPRNIAS